MKVYRDLNSVFSTLASDARAEELAEGRAEGRAEGERSTTRAIVLRLKRQGLSLDAISDVVGLSENELLALVDQEPLA